MKASKLSTGYDIYFRASLKPHRAAPTNKHHATKVHTRRVRDSKLFAIPDEQMSEPPVVPKEERRYWH